MQNNMRYLLIFISVIIVMGCHSLNNVKRQQNNEEQLKSSVIRVNVTRQGYNFHRPWQQRSSSSHTAIGAVLTGSKVLVTAKILNNYRYIELEKIDSNEKTRAEIETVDYEADLAILKPIDVNFLSDFMPLKLATSAVQGDSLSVLQVKPNGNIVLSKGPITAIELSHYAYDNYFLSYKLNNSLQYRFSNNTLPVLKDKKLAGLLMRYDGKAQTIDVIAAPVVEHFLKDVTDKNYNGFPTAGFTYTPITNPQLRRFAGIPDSQGGVYIENVIKGSPAAKGKMQSGDILVKINGFPIDSKGQYRHPLFGEISLTHIIRCNFFAGDTIGIEIYREGKRKKLSITLKHRLPSDYLVPPYIINKPPRYFILGGLIFQELSTPYLQEYGKEWSVKAPMHLLFYKNNQDHLDSESREKIVILSGVIPNSNTIGYEKLRDLEILRINDIGIQKLADIPDALKDPINGYHKIEFEQYPKVIYLDPDKIKSINQQIKKRYHIPSLWNLD